MKLIKKLFLVVAALAVVSGCDFAADNATRVAQAEQALEREDYREAVIELKNVLRSDPSNIEARVLLGRVSLAAGDPASAAKELQRARELGAEARDYVVPLARALLGVGRFDDVMEFAPDQLDTPGERASLNAILGNAHLRKSELGQAQTRFEAALAEQNDHADALVGMARIHLESDDVQEASRALERVIASNPDAHAAHAVLGRLHLNNGEYSDSEASFRKAIASAQKPALMRERMTYLAGLVDALLVQRKSGEAQDVAAQMLDLAPEHPYGLFQAARADFESGELDNAIDKSQRVISAFPDYQPARLLLAAAAMSKENFALAEVHLQSLVNANPNDAQVRRLLAQAKMSLGSPEEAFNALEPLIEAGATDPQLLTMAGSAGVRSGRTEEGLAYLQRGAEAGSGDPAVQIQAASSYIAVGEIDKAIELLDGLPAEMHGKQRDFLIVLARLRDGNIDSARDYATSLVEKKPDDSASHRILGGFYMAVRESEAARASFERALELAPDDPSILISLARLDVAEGQPDAARRRYEAMLEKDPANMLALMSLSHLAEQGGDPARAVELLETAREKNPDAAEPVMLLARYYLRKGQEDLALERANEAVARAPASAVTLNLLGSVQYDSNRHSEALGTFERALQQGPNNVDVNFNLSRAQLKLGMNDAARRSLKKTLEIDPSHLGARVALARMEALLGNYAAALEITDGLKEEYPSRAEPNALEGDIHIMRGHYNDAIAAYDSAGEKFSNDIVTIKRFEARKRAGRADSHKVLEEWLAREDDNARVRLALAQAYQDNGLEDQAITEYERVLDSDADSIVALNNLAWIYSEKGGAENLRKGVAYAKTATEMMPDLGQVTDTYGWLLLKQGKVDEAMRVLRTAARQAPDDPEIRYHLAVALHRSGSSAEARDLLDAILADGSGFSSRDEARALRESL